MKTNQITIAGAVLFKDSRGKRYFLLIKQKEGEWELSKAIVRRGESSVRAAIRMTAEQGGLTAKVLEEAGRASGIGMVGGKSVPQKYYYYLMIQQSAGEMIGFEKFQWLEFNKALKELSLKREQDMLKSAKEVLKEWEKKYKK
jgi:8-oxo-dGTP pyrophosphatase MutT (NUDIX family)